MWSSIDSLTLIVHLPIYLVDFPANAQVLFEALIGVVTFDFLGIRDILGVESGLEFTPTSPYSENFDKLGYGSQNTIDNLGTINFILAGGFLHLVLYAFLRLKCCTCKRVKRFRKQKYRRCSDVSKKIIRLFLEIHLELLICSLITVIHSEHFGLFDAEEWTGADRFMFIYTVVILVATTLFLALSLWF